MEREPITWGGVLKALTFLATLFLSTVIATQTALSLLPESCRQILEGAGSGLSLSGAVATLVAIIAALVFARKEKTTSFWGCFMKVGLGVLGSVCFYVLAGLLDIHLAGQWAQFLLMVLAIITAILVLSNSVSARGKSEGGGTVKELREAKHLDFVIAMFGIMALVLALSNELNCI